MMVSGRANMIDSLLSTINLLMKLRDLEVKIKFFKVNLLDKEMRPLSEMNLELKLREL